MFSVGSFAIVTSTFHTDLLDEVNATVLHFILP